MARQKQKKTVNNNEKKEREKLWKLRQAADSNGGKFRVMLHINKGSRGIKMKIFA